MSKATQRLYFLKHLRRAGVPNVQLLHFYLTVIRPILEYVCPVWNHSITKSQSERLESIQKRALNIIYNYTIDLSYCQALFISDIQSLADRRDHMSREFFTSIICPGSSLHSRLPPPCDLSVLSRLRSASRFPRLPSRTKRGQSFIAHALSHYQ